MKKSVTVAVSEEKLSAIEMYLEQKNTTLAAELNKYIEHLYQKNVLQNVRDFIDMMSAKKACEKAEKLLACRIRKAVREVIRPGLCCVASCGVFIAWVG